MNAEPPHDHLTPVHDMAEFTAALAVDELPVLVDVTAEWCQPCKVLEPHLREFAREHAARVRVISVDADTNAEPMLHHGVYSMPTLMLFDGGTLLLRMSGEPPERLEDVASALVTRDRLSRPLRTAPEPVPVRAARTLRFPDKTDETFHFRRVPPTGALVDAVSFDASGTVEVPEGWHTELAVMAGGDEGVETGGAGAVGCDVTSLAALPHDAVDELTVLDPSFGDEHLAAVEHLTTLRVVMLRSHSVSGRGLRQLAAVEGLRVLDIEPGTPAEPLDPALVEYLLGQRPGLVINNEWLHPQLRPASEGAGR